MKKWLMLALAISALICGGCGGSDGGESSTQYDLKSYFTSLNSVEKSWDMYELKDSSFANIASTAINNKTTSEIVSSSSVVIKDSEPWVPDITITYPSEPYLEYSYNDDTVKLNRNINLGDNAGGSECSWAKHYEVFNILSYSFNDVLELKCINKSTFFAKNYGQVAEKSTVSVTIDGEQAPNEYFIEVVNNI
ncbi:MAG: hypothetical protein RBR54_02930 [Sulfurimonas sp.]|jgi:hypothetical protein|nr:hypothetical protein [Sulfurimonas sp.]